MIRQLPPSVRSQLRSGVAITSVTQCVEELLLNSVDAESKCIAVRVDLSCFRIQVVDNGTGIAADQLDYIGERYSTSKCQSIEDLESLSHFGYRGEALASIRDVSYILEVTSRFRCSAQTYCKIFQQGKSHNVMESKIHRPSPGTTITVHNLFYNLPVRQKSISASLEMESICHRIEALALMQPTLSITLRNDSTGSVLIQTHKTNSPLVTFSYLYNHTKSQSMVTVSNTCGPFCIKGYISKESHYRKDLQFIYVNKRLVLKTQLHKLINRLLKKSLIVRQRQALDTNEKLSPSKQADKYPVFILNIQCSLNAYDITFDPRKTMVEFVDWDTLTTGVEEMCKEFLRKENLLTVDCLLSEERNEKNNENHEIETSENSNKLSVNNHQQTTFDKIDDEMFNNVRTRGLKSCPIKRLFDENYPMENTHYNRPTANKQSKTENVSAEDTVIDSKNVNFQTNSASNSESISNYSEFESDEKNLSVDENVSHASKSLPYKDSNLFKDIFLESEKLPFEELKMDTIDQMTETCFSDSETEFCQKSSLESNYINEKLNIKKISVIDSNQNEALGPKSKTNSIQSFDCEKYTTNKSIPLCLKSQANKKVAEKPKDCNKNQVSDPSLPSEKNILSMFRNDKRNSKELLPAKLCQSTRMILDQFRAPQHKRETRNSIVDRLKPDMKTLQSIERQNCVNVTLENRDDPVPAKDSKVVEHKEQLQPLRVERPEVNVDTHCENSSVQNNEMLEKLLAQKSSKNSIASKLSKLCKNTNIKSPSKTESSLSCISAEQKEKCKYEIDQNKKKVSDLKNHKINSNVSNLDPNPQKCCIKDFRKTEIKESFTSLQDYKSVPSLDLVNPLLNLVADKKNNPKDFVCQPKFKSSKDFVEKKKEFLCSSAFLQTLDCINPSSGKREDAHQKEDDYRKSLKNFDLGSLHSFSSDKHDEYKHFSNCKNPDNRTGHHWKNENICFLSHSIDGNDRDVYKSLSKSISLSNNKTSSKQPYSHQDKHISIEEFSKESFQSDNSLPMDILIEKPLLSLDFTLDKEFSSLQNCRDTISTTDFQQNIFNNKNSEDELNVCKLKLNNHEKSLITTQRKINLENENSSSLTETQTEIAGLEEIITDKRNQIDFSPLSEIHFDEGKMRNEKSSICYSLSASLMPPPTTSMLYKEEAYTKLCQEKRSNQRSNQGSSDTANYLHESPKIINVDSKTPRKSMSCETNELISDSSDSSKMIEETSNKIPNSRNHTLETLNETSSRFTDDCKTLNNTLEAINDILKDQISTLSTLINDQEITVSSGVTMNSCIMSNSTNSQCKPGNILCCESTTDQSELVLDTSFITHEECAVKQSFNHSNESPPIWFPKVSSPSASESLDHKTNVQVNASVSSREDSPLRKPDDLPSSLTDQPQSSYSPLHRSALSNCSSNDSNKLIVQNVVPVEQVVDLKSNNGLQHLETEYVSKPSSSHEAIIEFELTRENSRNSQINNKKEIEQQVSSSFSKEVGISQNGKKSSDTPMDSCNIQPTNVDNLENLETILIEDPLPANGTLFQPGTSDVLGLNANKNQENAENLFESNDKNLEIECTENTSDETEKSYLEDSNFGCCHDEETDDVVISDDYETDLTLKLWRNWKNPVFQVSETDVLDVWSNNSIQQKLHRVTHSCQFTKAMLSQMETIGQVDNKFIACIVKSQDGKSAIPDHLLMIDQHAAHERIRLEQLTADMYQLEDGKENEKLSVKFSQICPPWMINLSDKEIRIVTSFSDEFEKIGLQLKIHQEDNTIEIHTAPSCIMAREASERKHNRNTVAKDLVLALIKEEIELLHDTHGAHSTLPKTIHKLLCSQACHGAIKFNDPLTLEECQNLLRMLLKCKLPFQCAHGRPSVIPLLNLQHFKQIFTKSEASKINLKKLKKQMEEQMKMDS